MRLHRSLTLDAIRTRNVTKHAQLVFSVLTCVFTRLITATRRTALLTALLPTGILSLVGVLATPAMATAPTNPRLPALVRTPFSVNGQNLTVQISEDVAGNAVAGLAQIPAGAAAYLTIQQCTLNETGCTDVPSSARSYPAGGSNTTPVTGAVTPVNGRTYRTCAIVNVGNVTRCLQQLGFSGRLGVPIPPRSCQPAPDTSPAESTRWR